MLIIFIKKLIIIIFNLVLVVVYQHCDHKLTLGLSIILTHPQVVGFPREFLHVVCIVC